MKKYVLILMFFIIPVTVLRSQDKAKFTTLSGYVSTMQSVMFDSLSGQFVNENIIHNRLNFKGYINENVTFAAEFRNRLFTGDMVRSDASYADINGKDKGLMDLSWNLLNKKSFLLNTTVDRLWLDLNYGKFQARIGRQRINWGQTLVWNPNDIFNAYSYFDFDYVERPGSDAIRLQYYPNSSSAFEFAVKSDNEKNLTAAGLFRFNKWGYDFQLLAGYAGSEDLVAGAGWSGALGSVSFRGEFTLFKPAEHFADSSGTALFTAGFDKIFSNNSMIQAQFMYCNNPVRLSSFGSLYSGDMSAKDLAFSKFSSFLSFAYPLTPLINTTISAMWIPDLAGYFAGPSLDYSVAENVDISLFWQHFSTKMNDTRTRINIGFLRVKFSF
jgi:hypothetical protein